MFSRCILSLFSLAFACSLSAAQFVKDESINLTKLGVISQFKGSQLCKVAHQTRKYLEKGKAFDDFAIHAGEDLHDSITLNRVKETLAFLCDVYREDVAQKRLSRLHNAWFIRDNFDFYRWTPDLKKAKKYAEQSTNKTKTRLLNNIPKDKIFLTKYYTKLLEASGEPTQAFSQALYQIPYDEVDLTFEEIEAKKDDLTRYKYTRGEVIGGVLLKNKLAKPLIWLSENSLHDVLLQGTGVLKTEGKLRYFNVHRNNGYKYNYAIGKTEQPRYWYFAEVPGVMGYGKDLASKIQVQPQVTFAGNVKQLGLGKLLMVNYPTAGKSVTRFGVLADQGGAFDDNLFQVDMLVDSYYGWQDYYEANKLTPDYANVWIALKKQD